jgi:Rod binding domain-containing protein
MIDQQSAINSKQSVILDNAYQTKDNKIRKQKAGTIATDIENKKAEYKKVAKDMESLFAYQLLKTMRETTDNLSDSKKENGYDTYMSLFDMEVSKLFSDRGLGLQDAIINSLERSSGVNDKDISNNE